MLTAMPLLWTALATATTPGYYKTLGRKLAGGRGGKLVTAAVYWEQELSPCSEGLLHWKTEV